MTYLVIELQTAADGTVAYIVSTYVDRNAAESQFHTILASAAVSQVPTHTAVLITNKGQVIKRETYYHSPVETEPEVEENVNI